MDTQTLFRIILDYASSKQYSDIHFSTGSYPIIRDASGEIESVESLKINEELKTFPELSKEQVIEIIREILWNEKMKIFIDTLEIDGSYHHGNETRYRINCYQDSSWFAVAMRLIPQEIPTLESLWLWEQVMHMCKKSKWLILVTGPTGVWKSTNLAWMINYINTNQKKHIITIEDPIEFVFKNKKCLINQREVWLHTKSFWAAMKSSLREDPDIIMAWEMRDPETIKTALSLAETGHLVLSTLHTNDTVQSIDRIVDTFPAGQQEQIRMQLAMSLIWIISQRLVPRQDKDARIAAREILINNDAVRNLILTGNTHQLYSVIEISKKQGMILLDHYLEALYNKGIISKEVFASHVRDRENIKILQS